MAAGQWFRVLKASESAKRNNAMATFELSSPDGRTFEVEAPNQAAAISAFQKMSASRSGSANAAAPMLDQTVPQTDAMGTVIGQSQAPAPSGMGYGDQMRNVGGALDKTVRMLANGATFGLADKAAGGADYLTGNAPSYDAGVKAQRAQTQAIRDEHPTAAAVGEAVGGLGSGAGLIRSGVTVAGRVGAGLLPRVLGYSAEGAAYGGAHGAGNTYSDNFADYLKNGGKDAAIGAMVGGGLPVLGSVAGGAYRTGSAFLGPRVEGTGRGASALLRGAAQADEAGLRSLNQLGPEAMLPDAGPAMLGLAQGAATGTGGGRSALIDVLQGRDRATAQRLMRSLDDNLGAAPVPSQVEAGLEASREAVGTRYNPIMQNARAVNTEPLATRLEGDIGNLRGPAQRAVRDVRGMLDIPGNPGTLDPHPQALLSTRHAIDGLLSSETNPQVIRNLTIARQQVDSELARAAPGIKDVDAQFAELQRQSGALQRGGQVLDSGKQAIRPQELTAEIQQSALPQGTQIGPSAAPIRLRQGVRADIDRRVGTNVNDLTQLEKTFATPQDWNYQKLGTVFGEGPRDQVAADIIANRRFRDTYQKVAQNSQTAQRMEAAKSMEGAAGGNIPTDITATSLSLKAINGIAKILSGQSNATTRDEVGRLLSAQGPQARRLAQMLLDSAQSTGANAQTIAGLISSPRWIGATAPAVDHR